MLRATIINSNFLEVEIPVVFSRQFFLDKDSYIANRPPKPQRETKEERAARFQRLMDDNGWSRAELARQLGVSRAWVTKVLRTPNGVGAWR
ncbi:helix-turn-helix domain-containing protein [Candidatus Neomarinimicrobiota bacterium]